jgi:uncharacterized membrane protein
MKSETKIIRPGIYLLTVLVLTGLVACGGGDQAQNQTSVVQQQVVVSEGQSQSLHQIQIFKGHALYGHEVRSFQQCNTNEVLWAIDKQGVLWQLHKELASQQQPYIKLFAMVKGQRGPAPKDGFGADVAGSLLIEEVLYVAAEGFDCNYNWQEFSFRTIGNEPFWSAMIVADDIKVTQLGQPIADYKTVTKQQTKQGIYYQGKGKDSGSVELTVITKPCRDTMSGAYYGLTARLKLNGKELIGCAIPGEGR